MDSKTILWPLVNNVNITADMIYHQYDFPCAQMPQSIKTTLHMMFKTFHFVYSLPVLNNWASYYYQQNMDNLSV